MTENLPLREASFCFCVFSIGILRSLFPLVNLPSAVIATMRDLKRKDKLVEAAGDTYGKTLSLAVLDVCSDESVKQCINGIKDRHVDVLGELNKKG